MMMNLPVSEIAQGCNKQKIGPTEVFAGARCSEDLVEFAAFFDEKCDPTTMIEEIPPIKLDFKYGVKDCFSPDDGKTYMTVRQLGWTYPEGMDDGKFDSYASEGPDGEWDKPPTDAWDPYADPYMATTTDWDKPAEGGWDKPDPTTSTSCIDWNSIKLFYPGCAAEATDDDKKAFIQASYMGPNFGTPGCQEVKLPDGN